MITGRDGQVATSLQEVAPLAGHEIIALGRPELDLAGDVGEIADAVIRAKPDAVISAAAFTAVDRAEDEAHLARTVNVRGAGAIAEAATKLGVPLLHLSTDYVFDGLKDAPYVESDPTCPTSVYGKTKRDGENAVLRGADNVAILRTAWVYSPFGNNFVKTMLRLADERDEISVVDDQWGNPTSALDIAGGLIAVAENMASSDDVRLRGIFHMTAAGATTWAGFAETIFEASAHRGGPMARVRRIATSDYPTAARRPANSRLDCTKLERAHGVRLPDWKSSVNSVVERLVGRPDQEREAISQ